jgi:hypothetical protein
MRVECHRATMAVLSPAPRTTGAALTCSSLASAGGSVPRVATIPVRTTGRASGPVGEQAGHVAGQQAPDAVRGEQQPGAEHPGAADLLVVQLCSLNVACCWPGDRMRGGLRAWPRICITAVTWRLRVGEESNVAEVVVVCRPRQRWLVVPRLTSGGEVLAW